MTLDFLWGIDSPMALFKAFKNIYHYLAAHFGAFLYGYPSKELFVIGVTGTKGKTTTIELINAGLEAAGHKTALNSSLRRKIDNKFEWNKGNSMPGRFYLQRFLRNAKKAGCEFAIVEVTSEGVVQSRHRGIHFDAAVFTGLHPEHIESHGSFEKYRQAKLSFFEYVRRKSSKFPKFFFVNMEDENATYFINAAKERRSVKGESKIFLFLKSDIESNLTGDFNRINIGAAESFLTAIGIPRSTIKKAFSEFRGIPGRMEHVQESPFKVFVDYAHTPESLRAVYESLSKLKIDGSKLTCVLGSAGGGRDKWKRSEFGGIAEKYCDRIILTNEDPYDEDPSQIIHDIQAGMNDPFKAHTFLDRKEAIRYALSLAKPDDIIILTGKGSERVIHIANGRVVPWSDKEATLEILRELK